MCQRCAEEVRVLIRAVLAVCGFADVGEGRGIRGWEVWDVRYPGWVQRRRMGED